MPRPVGAPAVGRGPRSHEVAGRKPRVLYVCHNHPCVVPGGAETYALELYEAMREAGRFEPILLARTGPPVSKVRRPHEGTLLGRVNDDPNQYFFYTEASAFDWFHLASPDKTVYTKFFRDFLLAYRPDVVHFQHTLFLGIDILREVRNSLPDSPIVYTLHEYLPICHRNGQMLRTVDEKPCSVASPRRCHECFPEISPQAFFARRRFLQSHLQVVDLFLTPSRFLLERYAKWGIPREKLRYEEYGRRVAPGVDAPADGSREESAGSRKETGRPRNRLGFFGQLSHFKGVNVLLQAMEIVGRQGDGATSDTRAGAEGREVKVPEPTLRLHGANLELQPEAFREEFRSLLKATTKNVTFVGPYEQSELADLMSRVDWVVIPSIWWENSPLVIQEAFMHRKPVICSDIGGMAEKVRHGVDGLHFRAGDPASLADTIREAVSTPGLWSELREGIRPVYAIEDSVRTLADLYEALLASRAGASR